MQPSLAREDANQRGDGHDEQWDLQSGYEMVVCEPAALSFLASVC